MAKGRKAKKTKAPRKPQPLPKSVTALLKYLGGSDVRVGSSRPQPATLAPTAINIAVTQQQQQTQQFVKQRVAPVTGTVIGKSPLAAIIPSQPVIIPQAPSSIDIERKIQEQSRIAESRSNEINRQLGIMAISQEEFEKQAGIAYRNVKDELSRRVLGDDNTFDAKNVAYRFSSRPIIEEPRFAGMAFAKGGEAKSSITEAQTGSLQEEASAGLGEYLGEKYVTDVSSPEMTPIRRGRPRKTEEEKKATRKAYQEKKKMEKQQQITSPELASSASLLESIAPSSLSSASLAEASAPTPVKKLIFKLKKKPVSTEGAPDMASQIALLTGASSSSISTPRSQGRTIAQMMGSTK
jgi:hypothetical protein